MKVALFVLSGDNEHFVSFITSKYPKAEIQVVRYSPDASKGEWMKKIRNIECDAFFFCCDDLRKQGRKRLLKVFSLFIKAKEKYFIDESNRLLKCSLRNTFLENLPLLIIEPVIYFLVLGFTYWFCFLMSRTPRHRMTEFHNHRRVAYLRTDFRFNLRAGGSVTHISGFASGVLKTKYKLFFTSSDLLENVNSKASPVFIVEPYFFGIFRTFSIILYNLIFIVKGLRILKIINPDFLYQRYSTFNFSGVVLARLLKIPLFLEFNSSSVFWARYSGRTFLIELISSVETFNLKHADVIVVVSNVLKRKLIQEGIEQNRILVNPNCVNPRMFHPSSSPLEIRDRYRLRDKTVVGWIGTFELWHGIDFLASAIPNIIKRNKNIHFLLIGGGKRRDRIERMIEKKHANAFVTFTGIVPHHQVPKYLAACDILVVPHTPLRDGFEFWGSPTKLFEYMAMGKAIVASNLGQIGEVLRHNDNAYLIKPGDRRELVKAILELAKDDALRNRLGNKARKDVVAKHTWKQNAERVIEAYENLSY